ncbi:DEAD/DEAH box helicase family protein [Streptomyces sp. NRRL B-1381]|uniref:DEAD/DEAH box helicase family protein n=1 Tax=Streptomyces sp. NRRL B-1381 TaxID=1463829 RepID=UPI00099B3EE2|nr:DEAD/DEAH box helicase family protein [Streptomyces sp. NRRL B-1381]
MRPRQKDALKALTDAIEAGKERVTVVSACGTGKTHTASAAADHLAADGAVLVAVPTLELLTQTIERWQQAGRSGLRVGA